MRRGDEHLKRGRQGLGLGLFIVKQLVTGHEGTVVFRSSLADGTTFTVTLPRQPRYSLSTVASARPASP
jgi:signal transduction histidine kinase